MTNKVQIKECTDSLERFLGVPVSAVDGPARCKRLTMRIDPVRGGVNLTIPYRTSKKFIENFVIEQHGWIKQHLDKLPARQRLLPGEEISILGVKHRIVQEKGRFLPFIKKAKGKNQIVIGQAELPELRVQHFLKEQAHIYFTELANQLASQINRKVTKVTIKDTRTRWGSCTADGKLSFSWRMYLAEPEIAQYLVAHEVAHLVEMNHGPKFWRLCKQLSTITPSKAKAWIDANSMRLMRIGPVA